MKESSAHKRDVQKLHAVSMSGIPGSARGQAAIILVLALTMLLGFVAMAVDGGLIYSERRHARLPRPTIARDRFAGLHARAPAPHPDRHRADHRGDQAAQRAGAPLRAARGGAVQVHAVDENALASVVDNITNDPTTVGMYR